MPPILAYQHLPSSTANSLMVGWLQSIPAVTLSSIAVLLSAFAFKHSRLDREQDKSLSFHDDFWFRTVLFPGLYSEISKTVDGYGNALVEHPDIFDLDSFNDALVRTYNHCKRFRIISKPFVAKVSDLIDGLQNHVNFEVFAARGALIEDMPKEGNEIDFDAFQDAVIEELHRLHLKVSRDT